MRLETFYGYIKKRILDLVGGPGDGGVTSKIIVTEKL